MIKTNQLVVSLILSNNDLNDGFGDFYCLFSGLSFTNAQTRAIVVPCYWLTTARDNNSTGPVVCTHHDGEFTGEFNLKIWNVQN